jgi:hypothetical protein
MFVKIVFTKKLYKSVKKGGGKVDNKKPAKSKEVTESIVKMFAKHTFTKQELEGFYKDLAKSIADLRKKENEKSALVAQLGADIKKLEGETESLATKVQNGYEHKNMDCIAKFDWGKDKKEIIHPETGEVLWSGAISMDERQLRLEAQKKEEVKKPEPKKSEPKKEGAQKPAEKCPESDPAGKKR